MKSHFLVTLSAAILLLSATCFAQNGSEVNPWRQPSSVPEAVYPEEAAATGLGGRFIVMVDVDPAGNVTAIRSLHDGICEQIQRPDVVALRKAATDVALATKFKPAANPNDPNSAIGRIEIRIASRPANDTATKSVPPAVAGGAVTGDKASTEGSTHKPADTAPPRDPNKYTVVGDRNYSAAVVPPPDYVGPTYNAAVVPSPDRSGSVNAANSATSEPVGPTFTPVRGTISGGVLNGKAYELPKPKYPAAARAVRASGSVVIQVLIDTDGTVFSAVAAGGHPLLQRSSEIAACSAKFQPTLLNGQPVKVSGVIVYNYVP
jgi:protein TonB